MISPVNGELHNIVQCAVLQWSGSCTAVWSGSCMGQEAVQLYAHAGQGGTGLSLQFADTCCWGPAVTLPVLASNWPPRTPPRMHCNRCRPPPCMPAACECPASRALSIYCCDAACFFKSVSILCTALPGAWGKKSGHLGVRSREGAGGHRRALPRYRRAQCPHNTQAQRRQVCTT